MSRFVFGGMVTALAGLVADHYGPILGGLFLAFPGIFPAGVSLVEKHKNGSSEYGRHVGKRVWRQREHRSDAWPDGIRGFAMARAANAQLPAYAVYRDRDVDCGVVALLVNERGCRRRFQA